MAPKRQRTSSSHRASIQPTFVSTVAGERYRRSIVTRKCIPERGIHESLIHVHNVIQERGWGEFAKMPGAAVVPVIREFYANAKEHDNKKALVRGRWVPFSRTTINELFRLPNIESDEYSTWLCQGPSYDEVIDFLAKPGTQWHMSRDEPMHFPESQLQPLAKAWHHFISARLMPTNHFTEVTRRRAFLNYAIQKGLSVDVGRVIEESILFVAEGKSRSTGLGHPSVIYALCLRVGVPTSPEEEIQHPKALITKSLIQRQSKSKKASNTDPGSSTFRPGTSTVRGDVSELELGAKIADIQDRIVGLKLSMDQQKQATILLDRRMEQLSQEQQRQQCRADSRNKRLNHVLERQEQQFSYLTQAVTALSTMFTAQNPQHDPTQFQFPQPPTLPPYPPPSDESEDDPEEGSEAESEGGSEEGSREGSEGGSEEGSEGESGHATSG